MRDPIQKFLSESKMNRNMRNILELQQVSAENKFKNVYIQGKIQYDII